MKRGEDDGILQTSSQGGFAERRETKERKPKNQTPRTTNLNPHHGAPQTHKPGSGFLRSSVPEFAGRKLQALANHRSYCHSIAPFPFSRLACEGVSFHTIQFTRSVAVGQVVWWTRPRLFLHLSTHTWHLSFFLASTEKLRQMYLTPTAVNMSSDAKFGLLGHGVRRPLLEPVVCRDRSFNFNASSQSVAVMR